MSGIRSPDCSKLAKNLKIDNDVIFSRHDVNGKCFGVVLFLLPSLATGPSFMSISSLVLELWEFSFIRDWPEIWKSEIPPSEFCPISGDWGELRILHLAWMSLIQFYWMLKSSRVTAFTALELLREIQLGGKITPPPPPHTHTPRLGLKAFLHKWWTRSFLSSIQANSIPLPVVIFLGTWFRQIFKSYLITQIFLKLILLVSSFFFLILHVALVAAVVFSALPWFFVITKFIIFPPNF